MRLCLINNDFKYEIEKLIRIFLPFEKIEVLDFKADGDNVVIAEIGEKAVATLNFGGKCYSHCREIENINGDLIKDSDKESLSETLAIAAIKYADLLPNRTTDYLFDMNIAINCP